MPEDSITNLYRHYDADGVLLYVGISLSAVNRLSQHKSSPWFDRIARVQIEPFKTRDEALDAETHAIQHERPLFNKHKRKQLFYGPEKLSRSLKLIKEAAETVYNSIPNTYEGALLLKISDAAIAISLDETDVRKLIKAGEIRAIKLGRNTVRVPAKEINRILLGHPQSNFVNLQAQK